MAKRINDKHNKNDNNSGKDKKMLTLFLILGVSLLLAMTSMIDNTFTRLSFQVVLLLIQLVIIKNVLDSYYSFVG